MIRKAIIVVLTIAASAVFLVWLLGAFGQLTLRYGMPDQNRVLQFGCYNK